MVKFPWWTNFCAFCKLVCPREMGVTCVSMWNVHCTIMSREQLKLLWAFVKYYPRKNGPLYGTLYASTCVQLHSVVYTTVAW